MEASWQTRARRGEEEGGVPLFSVQKVTVGE